MSKMKKLKIKLLKIIKKPKIFIYKWIKIMIIQL